jgi:hypothetical protein
MTVAGSLFPIVHVPLAAAESVEPLGTKFKFWYRDQDYGLTLFKEGRPNTGENWAEKIASELAALVGLPRAAYEFAQCGERQGVITPSMVLEPARLVHGNELLASVSTTAMAETRNYYHNREHTLTRVASYFISSSRAVGPPYGFYIDSGLKTAIDVFVGYLMFDAWIANQDRHSENWGLIRTVDGSTFLAPSYDHGSSMGRNETDERRMTIMTTRDVGQSLRSYAARARSALYEHSSTGRGQALLTLDAFVGCARFAPQGAAIWRRRLAQVSEAQVQTVFDRVPPHLMSAPAREFAVKLLQVNRTRILEAQLSE